MVVDVTVTLSVKVEVVPDGVRVMVDRFVEIITIGGFALVTVLLLVGTCWIDLVANCVTHCVVVCVERPKAAAWEANNKTENSPKYMLRKIAGQG